MINLHRLFLLFALLGLAACSSARVLAPTPNIFANGAYPQSEISQVHRTVQPSIFYVTDRNKLEEDGAISYGTDRSSSMAFGASTVAFGEGHDWEKLSTASGLVPRSHEVKLSIVENQEIVRFEKTPAPFEVVNGKPVRLPEAVSAYNEKRHAFQTRIREQMRLSGNNEVTIFVHGFNNEFEDGIFALADIWHFSGRRGVPISYSWPSGAGGLFGYFTDRESGEFTVFHFKELILQLSQIPELEKIHIVAHSRGTDVTTTSLRELIIAVRNQGKDPKKVLKIANLIMAAPDLDFAIVRQRLVAEGFGAAIGQITVYMNQGDSALGISQRIMSGLRLGRLTSNVLKDNDEAIFSEVGTVHFINVEGVKGLSGHAYYRTNRNVLSDIATIIRESAVPGSPSRPLINTGGNFWNMPTEYPF